jgi:hypothetical protein
MPAGHDAEVTPRGVRDGDPAALTALVARRGPAVLAFCAAVCEPADAARAAAEAFARFRAAVAAAPDASSLVPDELLLGATRHAAASLARPGRPPGGEPPPRPRPGAVCPDVPALLAARAGGSLAATDARRLTRHLSRCAACRELEAAFAQAEEAFGSPPEGPVPPAVRKRILAAMRAAAPVGPGPGPAAAAHGSFSMPAPQDATAEDVAAVPADAGPAPDTAIAAAAAAPVPEASGAPAPASPQPAGGAGTAVPAVVAGGAVAVPHPRALPRPPRREPDLSGVGPFWRWVLPGAIVVAGIAGAMAVAGVF